ALSCASPLKTSSWSLNLTSGAREDERSYLAPVLEGVQYCMLAPLGKNTKTERSGPFAAGAALAMGGVMGSRKGKGIAVPAPRSRVRRARCHEGVTRSS